MYLWKKLHPKRFISRGGRGYITQVKCTFRKILTSIFFHNWGMEGGREGVHHPSQIYLPKNLHPKLFLLMGEGGSEGVHRPCQIYLWKNLHPKFFYTFLGEGGRGYIAQVKCAFRKIYLLKNFYLPGDSTLPKSNPPSEISASQKMFSFPGVGGRGYIANLRRSVKFDSS